MPVHKPEFIMSSHAKPEPVQLPDQVQTPEVWLQAKASGILAQPPRIVPVHEPGGNARVMLTGTFINLVHTARLGFANVPVMTFAAGMAIQRLKTRLPGPTTDGVKVYIMDLTLSAGTSEYSN